jgi:glycerol kinase
MTHRHSSYFLGVDQGTTQTTAIVVDEQGRIAAQNSVRLPVRFPAPGRVEQDPWDILESVRSAAGPLIAAYPIAGAGFDNQGETFLLWDGRSGQPLTPAIVWQDKRSEAICQALESRIDADWLHRKTGLLLDSYFSAPKLRFLLENDPTLRDAARAGWLRFGTTESWVLWRLSNGRLHVTDPSTASRTLLFDINRLAWDDDLLELFDAPRAILPQVHPSAGYIGDLNFGAGPDIPLYALLVDQQAALFGQACFAPGDMKCTFGTGSFLLMNTGPSPAYDAPGLLATVAWQLPARTAYALDGGVFVAGAAVQWLAESLKLLPDAASSADLAAQSTDSNVVFVPALSGLAAPHWQTDRRGVMFGLSRNTTPADITRATLEGIALRVHEVATAMIRAAPDPPTRLKVDGGPSANPYLMQFLADLLDIEIHVAATQEATALGVANLAAHVARGIGLDELAARWRKKTVYTPKMTASARQAHLDRWQRALAGLQCFYES